MAVSRDAKEQAYFYETKVPDQPGRELNKEAASEGNPSTPRALGKGKGFSSSSKDKGVTTLVEGFEAPPNSFFAGF